MKMKSVRLHRRIALSLLSRWHEWTTLFKLFESFMELFLYILTFVYVFSGSLSLVITPSIPDVDYKFFHLKFAFLLFGQLQNKGCSSDGCICQNSLLFRLARAALLSSESGFRVLAMGCSGQCRIDFAGGCSAFKSPCAHRLELSSLEVNLTLQIVNGLTPVVFFP